MTTELFDEQHIKQVIDPSGCYWDFAKLVPDWIEPVPVRIMGAFDHVVRLPWFKYERQIDRDDLYALLDDLEIETYSIYRQIVGYEVCGEIKSIANRYVVELPDLVQAVILRLSI